MKKKYRLHNFVRESSIDILAMQYMDSIFETFDFFPYTGSSLRPSAMATVLNDILVNDRKNIIEFGSGISTLFISRLIEQFNLDVNFYSIEEDKDWYQFMDKNLERYNLATNVKTFYSPIERLDGNIPWHNLYFLKDIDNLDCVLVDGPKAFSPETKDIRKYALKFIKSRLGSSFSVFLDDCHRESERLTLGEWAKELGSDYHLYYQHLGVIFSGKHYNISL